MTKSEKKIKKNVHIVNFAFRHLIYSPFGKKPINLIT